MGQWHEDLISLDQARTLDGLFYQRVRRTPDGIAYRNYDRENKQWYELSWSPTRLPSFHQPNRFGYLEFGK